MEDGLPQITPQPQPSPQQPLQPETPPQWYALRVTYSRELKARTMLEEKGIRTFVPMKRLREEKRGKVIDRTVPAINNLIFAFADQQTIYDHIKSEGESPITRFIWDRNTRKPLIVPTKQMEDFIRVCETSGDEVLYLSEVSEQFVSGTKVRVRFGALAGVEGKVVRIKKSRRILVELPQLGAVASTYVPMEYLEVLPEES